MPDPTPTGPSPDALAIIAAQRELAATAEARADARQKAADEAAAARSRAAEEATERRHQERMAHERELQRRALAAYDLLPPDPLPPKLPPLPQPVEPPAELSDAQAQTYAALFKSEFAPYPQYGGTAGAKAHWREWGRAEWIKGDPPRRRSFQP